MFLHFRPDPTGLDIRSGAMPTMDGAMLPVQITGAIELRTLFKDRGAYLGCEFFGKPDT